MINLAITLYPHKTRVITFYDHNDSCVPECLNATNEEKIAFTPEYPLPFAKKDITAIRNYGDVYWLASDKGLARYCASEKEYYDKVMYFSADRDMKDNKILALCGGEDEIWVKTETCVSHIELKMMSMEEKADMLLEETLTIVERLGMVSQRRLDEGWNKASAQPYACSDNDGGFTAMYTMGLLFKYAVLKREKGADHEETKNIREHAIRSLEACLLLMFIPGRGDGFVARTYVTTADPVPDDGYFFRKHQDQEKITMSAQLVMLLLPFPKDFQSFTRMQASQMMTLSIRQIQAVTKQHFTLSATISHTKFSVTKTKSLMTLSRQLSQTL